MELFYITLPPDRKLGIWISVGLQGMSQQTSPTLIKITLNVADAVWTTRDEKFKHISGCVVLMENSIQQFPCVVFIVK